MSKAVILLVADDMANEIARLVEATLSLNGYGHTTPGVIDWPTVGTVFEQSVVGREDTDDA